MTEELIYAMQFLTAEGYVIRSPQDFFVFTNKFYKEFTGQDIGAIPTAEISQVKSHTTTISIPSKPEELKRAYLSFISECKVPARAETTTGDVYNLNQYSEKGAKAFKKILTRTKSGEIDMELLIKVTQLYYHSPGMKLKIGNFIGDGTWETHYLEMLESIEKKSLKDHITHTLEHDRTGTSRYRLGDDPDRPRQIPHSTGTPGKKSRNNLLTQANK